jgi:16S rRNA (guanine(966)-N(2))-methyltransferase RsmD
LQIIAGTFKGRSITTPKGDLTRPTSSRLREALFNICQFDIEGALFLDLFAGSGAMGLEALSRGAKGATFIDLSHESVKCIKSNVNLLKVEERSKILFGDVFDWLLKLAKSSTAFDIIYADPPYEMKMEKKMNQESPLSYSEYLLNFIDDHPNLLSSNGMLFLEDAYNALPKQDHCKHLLLKSSRKMGRAHLNQYVKKS